MSELALTLFGPPRIKVDGRPVPLGRRKAVALLAYLAVSGQPHGRDALVALLWPDLGQRAARATLRRTLVDLNRALGHGRLSLEGDRVSLPPGPGLAVDVVRFRSLVAAVAGHGHPLLHPRADCLAALTEAAALCQDEFLAGFSLGDAPEFDLWRTLQAENLTCELATVLERLAHVHAGLQRFELAIGYARRWLALDPLHEPAHRTLMQVHAWAGDRSAALQQFEECARVLAAELGIAPDAETTALAEQIRRGDLPPPATAAEMDFGQPPVRHNLPPQATPFVGRARELAQVAARLADPACRLLTLVGPGGIGKTRLAMEAAAAQVDRFADGVRFVDTAPVAAANQLPDAIAAALGLPPSGAANPQRRLLTHVRDRHLLLVVDSFEHLLDGADLLVDLLHHAPRLKLLVTSRARLNLREEWLQPVDGMELPPVSGLQVGTWNVPRSNLQPATSEVLDAYDATRLFVQCAQRLQPDFAPDGQETALVVHICRLVEGMPLAIELAAAWLRAMPLAAIKEEMACGLDLLATTLRDMPARHRSMRTVFDQSWRLLSPRQRSVLRQLSVFRGGCTREAAAAVAGASLADLGDLVDASWLRLRASGRYDQHELVRQYCAERLEADHLAESGESAEIVRARHGAYFGLLLQNETERLGFARDALDLFVAEFGNMQAIWGWTIRNGTLEAGVSLTWILVIMGEMTGWYDPVIRLYEQAIGLLEDQVSPANADVEQQHRAAVLLWWIVYYLSHNHQSLGLLERARADMVRSISLLARIEAGQPPTALGIRSMYLQVWQHHLEGRFAEAHQLLLEMQIEIETHQFDYPFYGSQVGAKHWQAHVQSFLGMEACVRGDYDEAEQRLDRALEERTSVGEHRQRAFDTQTLAKILCTAGDWVQAKIVAEEAVRLSDHFGHVTCGGYARVALGRAEAGLGNLEQAQEYLHRALEVAQRSGNHEVLMESLVELGRIELALGRPAAAGAWFEEALASVARLGTAHSNKRVGAILGLGWAALAAEEPEMARQRFQQVLTATGRSAWEVLDAAVGLAEVAAGDGQAAEAAALLDYVDRHPATAALTRARVAKLRTAWAAAPGAVPQPPELDHQPPALHAVVASLVDPVFGPAREDGV